MEGPVGYPFPGGWVFMSRKQPFSSLGGQRVLAALVVGTALSAVGSAAGSAQAPRDATLRAVSAIERYCTACWRNAGLAPHAWPDCTQEVFCRLLARLGPDAWDRVLGDDEGQERCEFLRAIDAVKKRCQRSRRPAPVAVDRLADPHDRPERDLADDREAVRQATAELLSPRQRDILQLCFEGWTVQEIAGELNLPAERVSDEKYKAVQKLRRRFSPAA
jgi:RNA polymerase sigma factor (sigma-70 family)